MEKLRVVFFGTPAKYSLEPLKAVAAHHRVVGLVESAPRRTGKNRLSLVDKMGEIWLGLRGRPSLWLAARKLRVPYYYLSRKNMDGLPAFLKEIAPDVGCIASLNQLLPEQIIHMPRLGIINFHPSLLPQYRGPFVWFWYYHDMAAQAGVSIHFIDSGEDTGDILKQAGFEIQMGMDPYILMERTITLGAQLMVDALDDLVKGTARPVPQMQLAGARRARRLKPGERFAWWEWPLEHAWHFLRGTYPWYCPFASPISWRVSDYEFADAEQVTAIPPFDAFSCISLDRRGFFTRHPQGKIRLRPIIPWVRLVLLSIVFVVMFIGWVIKCL